MFNEFMDIQILSTFAGLTGSVMIIVQFTKSLVKNKFEDYIVRLYSFVIALILTFVFASKGYRIEDIIVTIINAIMITMTSMGGYELITDPKARKTCNKK
ncbi:hypothetical protein [Sedimentibacter sp. MB31-C6]|uniref:hypothetical protein n=1 Tax=Sedimentibacter sp. MB31-C6 TaxID=3109366 RepID=UPI002DDDA7BC|nr:hypothetical protein [Sedimentibacter sp. MB36-C1]WSI03710.1 hypothetical protein U8307_11705 [Sedimentibacter sp. MB36-C1]